MRDRRPECGARWLRAAITSIQDQTLTDFELIIVDDGSNDDSPRIIEESARHDSRIHVIRQERSGLVPALNRGIAESRGHLIARLDADDRAHPNRLQRQRQYLKSHPEIGLLGTWADKIDEQGALKGSLTPPTQPEVLVRLLARTNPFIHSSIMVRKAVIQNAGLYRMIFEGAEDYDLWMRISEITKIAILPEYLLQYRLHSDSVTHNARVRQLFSARLVQRAAQARRMSAQDLTAELTAPPNWQATESLSSPIYGDLVMLFRLLDLADSAKIPSAETGQIDIRALSNRNNILNHAERRMAQQALINLLKKGVTLANTTRAVMLWHFFRLHPLRAIRLGYKTSVRPEPTISMM